VIARGICACDRPIRWQARAVTFDTGPTLCGRAGGTTGDRPCSRERLTGDHVALWIEVSENPVKRRGSHHGGLDGPSARPAGGIEDTFVFAGAGPGRWTGSAAGGSRAIGESCPNPDVRPLAAAIGEALKLGFPRHSSPEPAVGRPRSRQRLLRQPREKKALPQVLAVFFSLQENGRAHEAGYGKILVRGTNLCRLDSSFSTSAKLAQGRRGAE
jgi:hypothetical protein